MCTLIPTRTLALRYHVALIEWSKTWATTGISKLRHSNLGALFGTLDFGGSMDSPCRSTAFCLRFEHFISRTSAAERENLIKVFSKKREWPTKAAVAIEHYLKALHILTENRNILIHGNIVDIWETKNPSIISMDRQGLTSVTQLSIAAIRQVADDIQAFGGFGYMLACYLASEFSKVALEAGMAAPSHPPPLIDLPKPVRPPQPKKPIA
jgi:hypothetical protein